MDRALSLGQVKESDVIRLALESAVTSCAHAITGAPNASRLRNVSEHRERATQKGQRGVGSGPPRRLGYS